MNKVVEQLTEPIITGFVESGMDPITGVLSAALAGYGGWLGNKLYKESKGKNGNGQIIKKKMVYGRKRYNNSGRRYNKRKFTGKRKRSYSYKKRPYKRTRTASVRRQLNTLRRRVESGMGTYVYKRIANGTITNSSTGIEFGSYHASNKTKIEAAIDALPVYDSTTGNTSNVDFTLGTTQKEVEIAKTYSKIILRNNYLKPARLDLYVCHPKSDTNIVPKTAITQGLTDQGGAAGTEPMLYPTDSMQFRDLWKIAKKKTCVLNPGQECVFTHSGGSFQYDPSFADSHTLEYQSRWKSHSYLIRIQGVPSHGATSGEGLSDAKVDCIFETHYTIKYDAGADLYNLEFDDQQDLVGNATVGMMDVEQNTTL